MKKLLALFIALIAIFALTACGDDDIPDGMQLVSGSDEDGYYFFAPEGWATSNVNGIAAAYVSRVNSTSVSFVEISKDSFSATACENAECPGATLSQDAHYFIYHYFDNTTFPVANFSVTNRADVIFGDGDMSADRARKYEFSYDYTDIGYGDESETAKCGFIQYYLLHDGRLYLMTYTAVLDVPKGLEKSNYESYLDELDTIVQNFRFVTKTGEPTKPSYGGEKDSDGYVLATNKTYSNFDFYAHPDYNIDFTSGIVSVTHSDGSNVTMSKASATGLTTADYIARREKELASIGATHFTLLTDLEAEGQRNGIETNLGNVPKGDSPTTYDFAFEFEYTYEFGGEVYHVYQIIAVEGTFLNANGYIFTYTAKEANYTSHLAEVKTMRDKVHF